MSSGRRRQAFTRFQRLWPWLLEGERTTGRQSRWLWGRSELGADCAGARGTGSRSLWCWERDWVTTGPVWRILGVGQDSEITSVFFKLNFNFEIAVDSCAILRTHTERFCVPFVQGPLWFHLAKPSAVWQPGCDVSAIHHRTASAPPAAPPPSAAPTSPKTGASAFWPVWFPMRNSLSFGSAFPL